jgi:predicted DNA-binding protein YlxM (UPF0122 family)
MKSLAQDIEASYGTRRAAVSEIVKETHQTLENFHREREEKARAFRASLSSETRERIEKTQDLLSHFAKEHEEMAGSLRRELSSFRRNLSRMVDDMMANFSDDRRQAHAHWTQLAQIMDAKRAGKPNPSPEAEMSVHY